jgi:hypothetical protein
MKLINVRSPYIISVNEAGQIETKIELRIWNYGGTKPTDPTYQFSKPIPSTTQRECVWNISNFAKDFIDNKLESVIDVDLTQYNYCNLEVKTYYKLTDTFVLKDTLDFICLNGYTNFVGGANQFKDGAEFQNLSLINDIIIYDAKASQYYIQLYFPSADYSIIRVNNLGTTTLVPEIGINNIYVGGYFTGTNQQYFAVINKSTKAIVTGYPSFNNYVYSITQDADNIYVGGNFTGRFAVINKSTKETVAGYPTLDNGIYALSRDKQHLYIGGVFTGRFAVMDLATKQLITGFPSFDNSINAITCDGEGMQTDWQKVYIRKPK